MEKDIFKLLMSGGKAAATAINPVAAGLAIAPEIGKGALALSQAIRARQLEKSTKRPVYAPPGAATEALNLQRNLAYGQAPGLAQATQLADRANAGANAAILDSGGGTAERMAALATVNQGAQESALRRGAMQGEYAANQQQALAAGLNDYAKYQDEVFRYNKDAPFMAASQKAAELRDAANVNAYDMAKSVGGAVASTIGYDNLREGLKRGANKTAGMVNGRQMAPLTPMNGSVNPANVTGQGEGPISPNGVDMARQIGGGIMQPNDEERGLTALPDYPNRLNPITGKPIGGIMPANIDQRSRRILERDLVQLQPVGQIGPPSPVLPPVSERDIDQRILEGERMQSAYNDAQSPYADSPAVKAENLKKNLSLRAAKRRVGKLSYLTN